MKLRLFGLNAPELKTPEGKIAQKYLAQLIPIGQKVVILTERDKQEKYGRWLATIMKPMEPSKTASAASVGPGMNVNLALISSGNAKPWDGKGSRPV
jgi:endonuclease YncB( thermonuclease family)